ncbi:hypothetical protein ANO11243_010850 [Dothideomycetidae sp. 11243]|nr:hypothetical protein ANO11243_010850 [fungal sp. No.11243]
MVYTLVVHLYAKDDKNAIGKLQAKLREASMVYSRDKETLSCTLQADFSSLQSQKYHLENPYWQTFDPYVKPLLERPMDLRRYEEMMPSDARVRRGSLDPENKVERDSELWKKVEAHQAHVREQGNY